MYCLNISVHIKIIDHIKPKYLFKKRNLILNVCVLKTIGFYQFHACGALNVRSNLDLK
jgi:hypothetical protein